jgi:hypothetical protein
MLNWTANQNRARRLTQDALDIGTKELPQVPLIATGSDANEIDLMLFGIGQHLRVCFTTTNHIENLAPEKCFLRNSAL